MPLTQHNRAARPGTTLVELAVAISLMAIVMAAVLPLISSLRNTWDAAQNGADALQNGRVLIDHLNNHLGQAVRITDVSPSSQTLGYIEFEDNDGDTIRYDVDAQGNVEYGLTASQSDLAGPVSQFLFTCYDGTDFDTPITDANDIRFVKVQTTVVNAATMGQDKAFSTSVYLQVNGNNISEFSMGTPFEFDTDKGKEPALASIDSTHTLCAYQGNDDDGWATILNVNTGTWAVTQGTPLEFDTAKGGEPALAQIDSTQYLCAYKGNDDDDWATILTVDTGTWTITQPTSLEFDTDQGKFPALAQIDDSHYVCVYQGKDDDGWAVVLTVGDGLVGHWTLDETSGTTAADSSDNGNNGTLTNMVGNEWIAGQQDGALAFSGYNDYITVANAASLQPTSALTMAAWIKGDAWGAGGGDVDPIVRKGTDAPCNYQLAIADQKVSVILDEYDNSNISGNTVLNTGQWYHVAGIWDGSEVRIYVNGVLDNTPYARTGSIGTDTRSLYIGGRTGADYLDGILGDVRFYERALSATEIAALADTLRYEDFSEAKAGSDTTSLTVPPPAATSAGDLLVAAVATDGDTSATLAPPEGQGWTQIDLDDYLNEVTLGTWWKLAGASEPSHQFTWTGAEQAYAWIMRFTGHDATDPIDTFSTNSTSSSIPTSPAVTTTVDNALILRLGAFDHNDVTEDAPGLSGHTAISMDSNAGSGQVSFEAFNETKETDKVTSLTLDTPAGTNAGDLLIAAVVTDKDEEGDLVPSEAGDWTEIMVADEDGDVTLGIWWRLAGASEPSGHDFEWKDGSESYAWIMRFSGHDPSTPIHQQSANSGVSSSPNLPSVTTTLANCLILRLGGFDDDDVNQNITGLTSHSTITMDESSGGRGSCSGGAGYQQQATPGTTEFTDFNLLGYEQYITLTVAIAPNTESGGTGSVSGGAGYVKQASAGSSGTSSFALTASEQARMLTLAIAPDTQSVTTGASTITKNTAYEFDTVAGKEPDLIQINATHYLCAYKGDGDDGWAVVLTVNTSDWTITKGTPYEFDTIAGKRPALAQIDSTHFLCTYGGDGDDGYAVVLTVNTGTGTISKGTPFEFDTLKGTESALAAIDSGHYLCAYKGDGDHGWSTILAVGTDTWTVSQGEPFEFDAVKGKQPALVQIDDAHYLCTYNGDDDDGWSVVIVPTTTGLQP